MAVSQSATLQVKVVTDATQAAKGMDAAAGGVSRFSSGLNKAGMFAGVAAAGVIAFGKSAFESASSAEQAAGAVEAVFGDAAGGIHKFAKDAADDAGLSTSAYENMAAVFGAQLKNMGVATEDLVPQTDDLIGMGADLAAQFGGSTADAVAALSSLLRGETDPIEKYGVSIKQADIEAKKAAMGLDGLTGEADKAATTQATLALLYDQTADATGAFARESDTAAGQQARASAAFENTKATLGRVLLPIVEKAAEVFGRLAEWIGENTGLFQAFAGVILGLAGTIAIIKGGMLAWQGIQIAVAAATEVWAAAQWVLNAALSANPIALVVIAVVALIAGIILAYKNCETFRKIVDKAADLAVSAFKAVWKAVQTVWKIVKDVFSWIRSNWPLLLAILTGPIGLAVLAIIRNWNKVIAVIRGVIGFIRGALTAAWTWLAGHVSRILAAVRAAIDKVVGTLLGLWGFIVNNIGAAWNRMLTAAQWVIGVIRSLIDKVVGSLLGLWGFMVNNIGAAWGRMLAAAQWVIGLIRGLIDTVIASLSSLWGWIVNNLGDAWGRMWSAAQWVLGLISGAIGNVIGAISSLYNWVASTMGGAWGAMYSAAAWVLGLIRDAIQWVIDKVNSLISALGNISWPSPPGWLKSAGGFLGNFIPGRSVVPPPVYLAPHTGRAVAMPRRRSRAAGQTGALGGTVINVNGAIDPDAVARQIERMLIGRQRRVSGVRVRGVA